MMRYFSLAAFFILSCLPSICLAAPDTLAVRVTDVTPNSLSLVWMSDLPAEPSVQVFSDAAMSNDITSQVKVVSMPCDSAAVAAAAKQKNLFKVRIEGLQARTDYYVRAVSADVTDATSSSVSALQKVTTEEEAASYTHDANGLPVPFSNDLVTLQAYTPPNSTEQQPGLGDIVLLEIPDAAYPISAFVGDGALTPEGAIDLNNLFGADGAALFVANREKAVLTVYRGGALSNLVHYRWLPASSGLTQVQIPANGFFADFNLDGVVDMADFQEFKGYYRTKKTDGSYNPDFDFVDDPDGAVDAREFSKFSEQYGRTGVPAQ